MNKNVFITKDAKQTRKLGELLAEQLRGGEIVCLSGELGGGKTTFAQGVLKGLGAKGPYTSPTFVVLKQYKKFTKVRPFSPRRNVGVPQGQTFNVYHIDAYRVEPKDILALGWEEIISVKNNVVIIEWAERVKAMIPKDAVWLKFEHLEKDKRKITVK